MTGMDHPSATGAELLVAGLQAGGVEVCFANPGTSELELVAALARRKLRSVLCLFEGVLAGAADGYGRMSGRPAVTLTHLGPGFAGGVANFHNARRARSPIVNVIGQNPIGHTERHDVGLNGDIASLARPVSRTFEIARDARQLDELAARALEVATGSGGGIFSLAMPSDIQAAKVPLRALANRADRFTRRYALADSEAVERVARLIRNRKSAVILLGGNASGVRAQLAAAEIARTFPNVRVLLETFGAKVERGRGLPPIGKLPYFSDAALKALAGVERVVLCGADAPITYFARAGLPDELAPPGSLEILAAPYQDAEAAIACLAERLGIRHTNTRWDTHPEPPLPARSDRLTPDAVGAIFASCLPEESIVSVESPSSGPSFGRGQLAAQRHTSLALTGGAIGQGIPVALGAAIACPRRPIYVLESDGSAAYTPQALWTLAHENIPATIVLAANRRYEILNVELRQMGPLDISEQVRALTQLDSPALDWVQIARGFGMEARAASTCGELLDVLRGRERATSPLLVQANI